MSAADDAHAAIAALLRDAALAARVMDAVCRAIGGGEVYLPRAYRPAQDAEIAARLQGGEMPAQVARAVGVSVATVRRRRAAADWWEL